jgi:hypothetical protein
MVGDNYRRRWRRGLVAGECWSPSLSEADRWDLRTADFNRG